MKIKVLFLTLFALMSVSFAYAYDFEVNGIYYNIEKDGAWVTNYKFENYKYIPGYSGTVVIPESVTNPLDGKTYRVTGIDVFAFRECTTDVCHAPQEYCRYWRRPVLWLH